MLTQHTHATEHKATDKATAVEKRKETSCARIRHEYKHSTFFSTVWAFENPNIIQLYLGPNQRLPSMGGQLTARAACQTSLCLTRTLLQLFFVQMCIKI